MHPIINKPIILKIIISVNISMKIKTKAIIDNIEDKEKCLDKLQVFVVLFNINHLYILIWNYIRFKTKYNILKNGQVINFKKQKIRWYKS